MGTPRWIQSGERRDAANHPSGYTDVANRPMRDEYDMFCVEHADGGAHKWSESLLFAEAGTYTGDGNDDREIILTNTDLIIKFLLIWREDAQFPVFASVTMAAGNAKELDTAAYQTNEIQSIATPGEFQIGTDATVNENGIAYFYLAFGIEPDLRTPLPS